MRKRVAAAALILTLVFQIGVAPFARAADGDLDTTFGDNGRLHLSPLDPLAAGSKDYGTAVALQPDGKIVAVGRGLRGGDELDFGVTRLNPDGSFDTSFDSDGRAFVSFGALWDDGAADVAVQPDGKIVVVGTTSHSAAYGTAQEAAVARLNLDGSLDVSFSADGRMLIPPFAMNGQGERISIDHGMSVVIQPDGRIVVGVRSHFAGTTHPALARLNTDGSLDTSFDSDGMVTMEIGTGSAGLASMALQPDGKIVVGGTAESGSDPDFALARLNTDGSLDTSFDSDGMVTTPIGLSSDDLRDLLIQPDGKIVAVGSGNSAISQDFALARYEPDGSLDTTFHTDGKFLSPIGRLIEPIGNSRDWAEAVALRPDGKLVVVGAAWPGIGTEVDFALARYNSDGSWDSSLSGPILTRGSTIDDVPADVAIQPDGKILSAGGVVGSAFDPSITYQSWEMVRYQTTYPASVPPETIISSGPWLTTAQTDATFSFLAGEAGSTFECRLDSGDWASCSSPKTYPSVPEGTHTFLVRATDTDGYTDPTPASQMWTVGTAPVDTIIDSGPSGVVASADASFAFSATESATFECNLDSVGWSSCTSPTNFTALPDGSHTFQVRATGSGGSPDPTPASRTWTVDATPPQTTIDSGPSGVASADASFAFSADESATFQCKLDLGAWGPCTSPKNYTSLTDGSHTFQVRAVDLASSPDPTPASRTWTVDATPPDTSITFGPSGTVTHSNADLGFDSTEVGSTFSCRLDGGSWEPCTSPVAYSSLPDGSHTFYVRATDAAGNPDPAAATRSWTVDTIWPETSIDSGPVGTVTVAAATFAFSAPDASASFACRLDAGEWVPCSSPASYVALPNGLHTFEVRASDEWGNTDPTAASRTWTVEVPKFVTTLSIKAPLRVIAGDRALILGNLTSEANPAGCASGQSVTLMKDGALKATKLTGADGGYRFALRVTRKTTVQVTFAGTATCAPSESVIKIIRLK